MLAVSQKVKRLCQLNNYEPVYWSQTILSYQIPLLSNIILILLVGVHASVVHASVLKWPYCMGVLIREGNSGHSSPIFKLSWVLKNLLGNSLWLLYSSFAIRAQKIIVCSERRGWLQGQVPISRAASGITEFKVPYDESASLGLPMATATLWLVLGFPTN